MNQADEEFDLIQRISHGDRSAFLNVYDRYASRVQALAIRMLGESMSAEEVTQDVFLKLWTRAGSFSPQKGKLLTWLLTITRRTAIDRIRLENRRPDLQNPGYPVELDTFPSEPQDHFRDSVQALRFAVLDLPHEQRIVIELAYYHGMSQSQMAEFLNIPLGTIKTRLRLGMNKLRQLWILNRSNQEDEDVFN